MLDVRRAGERYRGGDADAGVDTRHAFSFSGHYDPDNTGFGLLVACNEERLAPGAGFDTHPHRDLEIVTWVAEGELTHADSTGHTGVVRPGDLQHLSAGSGVRHSERNTGGTPLRFVQMWLVPGVFGVPPRYAVVPAPADAAPYALERTRAVLHVGRPRTGACAVVPAAPWVYVHVVRGEVELLGARLRDGDAARLRDAGELTVRAATGDAEFLAWEMHAEPAYG
ncbi:MULTISPECIES: pirin family protein [Streptomyces]|uniref:pirin family protein n=1 Tax=Streptomyces TaxID=1883 RepID=UPI0022495B14|nr:pirin family protein [Streptomyces sp. JHD 1]MCX2971247.1 pirin family protein [Streptomyces sp. JHD 1]